jgi:enolase
MGVSAVAGEASTGGKPISQERIERISSQRIADIAVATNSGQINTGSLSRSDLG